VPQPPRILRSLAADAISCGRDPAAGETDAMTTYSGSRQSNGTTRVTVNGQPLDIRASFRSGSSTAFDWGYEGRGGPTQLALAILAHHLDDDDSARRHYEHFLHSVVRSLPREHWSLTEAQVDLGLSPHS
jgi:hypothetical protein